MRGLLSIDIIIAFSTILLMLVWLQSYALSDLSEAKEFGSLSQLKAASIFAGTEINGFYAAGARMGSYLYPYNYTIRLFPGFIYNTTLAVNNGMLSKSYLEGTAASAETSGYRVTPQVVYSQTGNKVTYNTSWDDLRDSDGDGLLGWQERMYGTNLYLNDSDGDSLSDGREVGVVAPATYTSPINPDTDRDGLKDGVEVTLGTNPLNADTDGDRIMDGAEVNGFEWNLMVVRTDPKKNDTDGDGAYDGGEAYLDPFSGGTNPTAANLPSPLTTVFRHCNKNCYTDIQLVLGPHRFTIRLGGGYGALCSNSQSSKIAVYDTATSTLKSYVYKSLTIGACSPSTFNTNSPPYYVFVPEKIYPGSNADVGSNATEVLLVSGSDYCASYQLDASATACDTSLAPNNKWAGQEVYATSQQITGWSNGLVIGSGGGGFDLI